MPVNGICVVREYVGIFFVFYKKAGKACMFCWCVLVSARMRTLILSRTDGFVV